MIVARFTLRLVGVLVLGAGAALVLYLGYSIATAVL